MNQAKTDALATARFRLDEERRAYATCINCGWAFDAEVARREIIALEALIDKLTNPIAEFAQAINDAPKVADAPFALTSPVSRAKDAIQKDLFS